MFILGGGLIALVGSLWMAYLAYLNEDLLWAFAIFFCGFVGIVYGLKNLEEAHTPLFLQLAGYGIGMLGIAIGGQAG